MFLNLSAFVQELDSVRLAYFSGPMRSGKSLACFALGYEYIKAKKVAGIWSNVPHGYPKAESIRNAFVILDEPGQFFDSRFSASAYDLYGLWSGKTNSLYVFPSAIAVDKRVRNLKIMRVYNLDVLSPLFMCWFYLWESNLGAKGWFALVNAHKYFGTYESFEPPIDDGGTLAAIVSEYPEQVKEMLEARKGGRIEAILNGVMESEATEGYQTSGRIARSRELLRRIEVLEQRVNYLTGAFANVQSELGAGSSEVARVGDQSPISRYISD